MTNLVSGESEGLMIDPWEQGNIPWASRVMMGLAHTVPDHEPIVIVLSRRHFGYKRASVPVDVPFFYPKSYNIVPVEHISRVECLRAGWLHLPRFRIEWTTQTQSRDSLELEVQFIAGWIRAFRKLSVPVAGAGLYDPRTPFGLLRSYGLVLFLSASFLLSLLVWLLLSLHSPSHSAEHLLLASLIMFFAAQAALVFRYLAKAHEAHGDSS